MDENTDRRWVSPSGLVQDTLRDLSAAKNIYLERADKIDSWIRIVDAGQPYWDNVNEENLASTYSGGSAIDFLGSMARQAEVVRQEAERATLSFSSFNSTATVFGAITLNANTSIVRVEQFDPSSLETVVNSPNRDAEYAERLDVLDPELGRLLRQIHQTLSRTTSHPGKSIASDIRQVYDHFVRVLVPSDEVIREQAWWKPNPKDQENPNRVTRRHRYRYAAEKHVKNESERRALLASLDHALNVYQDLNKVLHTDKPVDTAKALTTTKAMLEILYQWIDALAL